MVKSALLGLMFFGALIGGYLFAGVWGAVLALVAFGFLWFGIGRVKSGSRMPSGNTGVDDETEEETSLPAVELDIAPDGTFTDIRMKKGSGVEETFSILKSMPDIYRVSALERVQRLTETWREAGMSADEIISLTNQVLRNTVPESQRGSRNGKSQKIATTRRGHEFDEYDVDDGTPGLGDILKAVLRRR